MPIILNILGNIPEELLQLANEKPVPAFNKLPISYQHILIEINNQLIELYGLIATDFPEHKKYIITLLAESMLSAEHDQLDRVINPLFDTNWLDNKNTTSPLYLLNMAFTKRNLIKRDIEPALASEKARLATSLETATDKHRNKIQKEVFEIGQMIEASTVLKNNLDLLKIFEAIQDDLLAKAEIKPPPKLDELTTAEQEALNKLGSALVLFLQKIPELIKIDLNADALMMIMAESISTPEFDSIHSKVEKLFDTPWLGRGIGIEYAALTNLFTAFMLRNAIKNKNQLSLSEEKIRLENLLQHPEKANTKIQLLLADLIKIRNLSEIADLLTHLLLLPSNTRHQPENIVIARFEEKLKSKIDSLKQEIAKEDMKDKNYETFTLNKNAKIAHLNSMLKQIKLYRFNALSLEDFIERVESFQKIAEQMHHTNAFKIFFNKHIDDFFVVETKKIIDEFHDEIIACQSKQNLKK